MNLAEWLWVIFAMFVWIAWIWMVISILVDIFRSDDLSGWGKAGWTVLVVAFTWIGVLIYLIARGQGMGERRFAEAARMRGAQEDYIRRVATDNPGGVPSSTADEIAKLAELHDKGVLSDQEFATQKARLLA